MTIVTDALSLDASQRLNTWMIWDGCWGSRKLTLHRQRSHTQRCGVSRRWGWVYLGSLGRAFELIPRWSSLRSEFCSRCIRLSDNQLKSWLPMIWSIYSIYIYFTASIYQSELMEFPVFFCHYEMWWWLNNWPLKSNFNQKADEWTQFHSHPTRVSACFSSQSQDVWIPLTGWRWTGTISLWRVNVIASCRALWATSESCPNNGAIAWRSWRHWGAMQLKSIFLGIFMNLNQGRSTLRGAVICWLFWAFVKSWSWMCS